MPARAFAGSRAPASACRVQNADGDSVLQSLWSHPGRTSTPLVCPSMDAGLSSLQLSIPNSDPESRLVIGQFRHGRE